MLIKREKTSVKADKLEQEGIKNSSIYAGSCINSPMRVALMAE